MAILSSLGAVLMLLDFPIFIAPSFYKLDLSDLPCLIGSFAMGPIPAIIIQILKIIIKLIFKPTSTAFVGELASFVISCAYCAVSSLIYQHNKTKKGAIKAILIGSIIMVIVSAIANYAFILPFYCKLYGMSIDTIIGLGKAIFPIIDSKMSFVLCCVVPFNAIKALFVDFLTIILYKRTSPLLKD